MILHYFSTSPLLNKYLSVIFYIKLRMPMHSINIKQAPLTVVILMATLVTFLTQCLMSTISNSFWQRWQWATGDFIHIQTPSKYSVPMSERARDTEREIETERAHIIFFVLSFFFIRNWASIFKRRPPLSWVKMLKNHKIENPVSTRSQSLIQQPAR